MKNRSLLRRVLAVVVMFGGLLFAAPMASAHAGGYPAFCQSGNVCAFEDLNLQGCQMNFATPDTDFSNNKFHKGLPGCEDHKVNDNIASIWNDSSKPACFYRNSNYRTYGQKIAAGGKVNVKYGDYSSWKRC